MSQLQIFCDFAVTMDEYRRYDDAWDVWPGYHWIKQVERSLQTQTPFELKVEMSAMFEKHRTELDPDNKRRRQTIGELEAELKPLTRRLNENKLKGKPSDGPLTQSINELERQIAAEQYAILVNDSVYAKARAIRFLLDQIEPTPKLDNPYGDEFRTWQSKYARLILELHSMFSDKAEWRKLHADVLGHKLEDIWECVALRSRLVHEWLRSVDRDGQARTMSLLRYLLLL